MFRALVIAAGAATLLGACTVSNDPYYSSGYSSTYYNGGYYSAPPARERYVAPGYYYSSGYQGGYYDRWGNWHSYR